MLCFSYNPQNNTIATHMVRIGKVIESLCYKQWPSG